MESRIENAHTHCGRILASLRLQVTRGRAANSPEQGELMQSSRHPSKEELLIISYLSAKGNYPHSGWQDSLEVAEMTDGMGSLLLIPKGQKNQNRLFGKEISEVQFHDADGMLVSVSLNIDQNGYLFELDVWRVDFGRVISFENLLKIINHDEETNNH